MSATANPFLAGNYAPVLTEDDFQLQVTGDLPRELAGSLYRNGLNPQLPPEPHHHWFHGDGMVHDFHIEDGAVRYGNRWVQTPKWLAERASGRPVPVGDGESSDIDLGLANTSVIWHGDRLLALEEGHAPFELDPVTLGSRGYRDFGGHVTAHPKIDPETGELIFFAYAADGPYSNTIAYGVADKDGKLVRRETFEAPYCGMIHDFLVTRDHVIIPVLPLVGDAQRVRQGRPGYAWERDRGSFVAVMRRDRGVASLRWFRLPPNYVYHVMNAFEADGAIQADVMQYVDPPLFPNADGSFPPPGPARLTRWTLDLSAANDEARLTPLDDIAGEFPRIDDRRSGLSYRHGWLAGQLAKPGSLWFDSLVHLDLDTGARQLWTVPMGDAVSEPLFVPRSDEADEGDGWVLSVVFRHAENVSDLVVHEARSLSGGPIATARLPRRVPFGFHGGWKPAA